MRPTEFQPPDELLMKQSNQDTIRKNKPRHAYKWTPPVKHTSGLRSYFMPTKQEDREEDTRKRIPQIAKQYSNIREARVAIINKLDVELNQHDRNDSGINSDPPSYQGADHADATTNQQSTTPSIDDNDFKIRINPTSGLDPPYHLVFVYYDRPKKAIDDNQSTEEQTNELTRLHKLFRHIVTHGLSATEHSLMRTTTTNKVNQLTVMRTKHHQSNIVLI